MPSSKKFRETFQELLPFAIHRKEHFLVPCLNGKVVPAHASITLKDPRTVEVAVRQCCVHSIIISVVEEALHAQGVLEGTIRADKTLIHRTLGNSSPGREAAYAMLSTLLKIPMDCGKHKLPHRKHP